MRVLIVGPGYVGSEAARLLVSLGHEVSALSRTGTQPEMKQAGFEVHRGDITNFESLRAVASRWDWVVNCVSSSTGGIDDYRAVYLEGTRNLIQWLQPHPPSKYVYTSSTGVYGQNDDSVVTETSATEPESETGKVLVETEKLLLAASRRNSFPSKILRVSGIYGPGRGFWLNQFLSGDARLDGDGSRVLNMVHRDDVAGAIVAVLEKGQCGEIYNVSDDKPVTQRDLFEWLAKSLKRPMPGPSSGSGQLTTGKRRAGSKRVSNAKLKSEVGYQFKFPSFREGFKALLADQS